MSSESRGRLAAQQAQLVAALTGRGAAPPGFDRGKLAISARSLVAKRQRAIARAWPGLSASLGQRFGELFTRYAEAVTLPGLGGPVADGRAFLRWLAECEPLPDALALESLLVDLRQGRGWPALAVARGAGRLFLGMRLPWPWEGAWVVSLRWAWPGQQ